MQKLGYICKNYTTKGTLKVVFKVQEKSDFYSYIPWNKWNRRNTQSNIKFDYGAEFSILKCTIWQLEDLKLIRQLRERLLEVSHGQKKSSTQNMELLHYDKHTSNIDIATIHEKDSQWLTPYILYNSRNKRVACWGSNLFIIDN